MRAPHRRPETAPPLWAVPARRPAEPEPTTPPAPVPPPAVPRPAPPVEPPAEPREPAPTPSPEPEPRPADDVDGRTDEEFEDRPSRWSGLRPPDIWNRPAPTLAEEIARARRGDHLPVSGPWRVAEQTRMWVSALFIAGLLLLVHINRSAARQAVAVLFVAAVVIVIR